MTTLPTYPEQLLAQTAWLQRLTRELVPSEHSADLAQETLVAALERPKPAKAAVRTWLERIARNLAAGGTRARYRRLRRERHAMRTEAEPSTADTLAEFEMHRSVVDAVQTLRDPVRTTLLLRFWEDLPPREIAKRMNAPVETVRTRIKRGLQELRGSLDKQHGRREAWSLPLLSFTTGRRAVAAPMSLAVTTSVILMNIKALAIGAIVVLGVIGAFVWNTNQPDLPSPAVGQVAEAPKAAASSGTASTSPDAVIKQPSVTPTERTTVSTKVLADNQWFEGAIIDERSNPIADIEVSWLTESEANKFRKPTGPKLLLPAVQVDRARWTLWHLSDRDWMKRKALLGDIFGSTFVTRSRLDGSFRFRKDEQQSRTVLVMWSPSLGCRFHTITSPDAHQLIVCKQWPRVRGRLTNNLNDLKEPVEVTIDYNPPRGGRALQFRTDASGYYETPPFPPGVHAVGFRAKGHHYKSEQFDLREDQTIDATLVCLPRLRARLVDTSGRRWTSQRFAALGWKPERMQFLLLREDFQTESDRSADHRRRAAMEFTADGQWLQGHVEDAQALVLSVWQGPERITATHLRDHNVEEITIDLPPPRTPTTLEVRVSLGTGSAPSPEVRLALGTMSGIGRYNFKEAAIATGASDTFQLDVPGFLRGQTAQLIVVADGFAEQTVSVPIPIEGDPQPVQVAITTAEFTLVGKVIDEQNQPLNRARILIATAEGGIFRSLRGSFRRTDEQGEFRFENMTNRHVRLFVAREGFATTSAVTWTNREGAVVIRLLPGVLREIDISAAGEEIVMLRVLDSLGAPLLDDHVYGAVHDGKSTRMRLSIHAHTLEVWKPGGTKASLTIDLQ